MKNTFFLLVLTVFLVSCNKESDSFITKYQTINGVWKTQSINYDSSGITITKLTRYDRLLINNNLTYKVYHDSVNVIENGTIKIITQTNDKLEIFFEPNFPNYSSFAGSYIFAMSNVILISLSDDEMAFRSIENGNLPAREFHFKKL